MKIIDVQQGSLAWLEARCGIPTASELNQLLTPAWTLRTGEMPRSYLARKLAEKWTGEPLPTWSGGAMEQGALLEEEALTWLAFEFNVTVERPGFITTDAGDFGCSPDAWLPGAGSGIEIKCPAPHTHVGWLMDGVLPKDHAAQVQGSMFATGATAWTFVSYCRRFPPMVVRVERNPEAQAAIHEAVERFSAEMSKGWARLVERNGGEPKTAAQREEEEALSF